MIRIQELFNKYRDFIPENIDIEEIFSQSDMVNIYGKLDFGFFPLGSGVFNKNSKIKNAEITSCKVMVLGNDFGTIDYILDDCPNLQEKRSNKTIYNLLKLGLNVETTFFTNLFLGLRINGTQTKRYKKLKPEYINFCFNFLKIQLDFIQPEIVLCLGKDVFNALKNKYPELFSSITIQNNFEELILLNKNYIELKDDNIGNRKFIFIPHPSFAHANWKNGVEEIIRQQLSIDEYGINNNSIIDIQKEKYKNAYSPWSENDDNELEKLFCEGKTISELSKIFERNKGAIESRIKKLELKEKYL